jgi:hypothetical protein
MESSNSFSQRAQRLSEVKSHFTPSVFLLLEMGIQLEMGLRLSTENLHFVLIKTFVGAELKLGRAIIEVDVAHSVADAFAEVASLGSLEGRSAPGQEAVLRAEDGSL